MRLKLIVILLSIILIMPSVHGYTLKEINTEININNDKSSDWVVDYEYNENITESSFFVISKIINVEVLADSKPVSCEVSEEYTGMLIFCKDIKAASFVYKFTAINSITTTNNLNIFKYTFSVLQPMDNFTVTVKLPLGTGLIEESKLEGTGQLPYEPSWGVQGTDGRKIFIKWDLDQPKVGDKINVSIIYEELTGIDILTLIAIIAVSSALLLVIFFSFRRKSIKGVLPILTEGERKVMEIVLREGKVDQRVIVKETDFSKAKVSRVVQDLISRGLVEKTASGRKNIIKLKRGQKEEKK